MKKQTIQFGLAGVGLAVAVGLVTNVIVSERLEDLENEILVQQEKQRGVMSVIAETTARNGADDATEAIVQDCPGNERIRFDELLGRLDQGLSRSELVELDRLFAGCGSFFAERKAVMVSRLEREYDLYVAYTEQLEAITGEGQKEAARVDEWGELVRHEKAQNEHFGALVRLQQEIITTLLNGRDAGSEEIVSILTDVREARENLALASTQAGRVRGELLSI
jgi:hypothetical protein